MSDSTHHFWATVHIYGRSITQECPYLFTRRPSSYKPQAIQLAAREATVHLRHLSPRVNCRPFYYYPSCEGYGRLPQVTNEDHESDPTLLHLVRYMSVQEALYEQVTLDLIVAHGELARLNPRRREAEIDTSNPVVLFGRPIEPLRSNPTADPNPASISPRELHRILGNFSNGAVATATSNGHQCYPSIVAPPTSPSNPNTVVPAASTSARLAHLDVN
ncbi:hypothetical protein D1007_32797 [Hordeum vulgare]|nr:hypothetical protein D1007_32797 [Hordeum vulgare]